MPGPLSVRPHRTKGSWIPRLAGVGLVVVLAAGALAFYLSSVHHAAGHAKAAPPPRTHPTLSTKVLRAQTVGLINFGPDDDADAFLNDADDHPLKLQPAGSALDFVPIPASELIAGVPLWTADQMADGTVIFIYNPTGQCLSAAASGHALLLVHCDLQLRQRWRPVHPMTELGQPFAAYANAQTGGCMTAATMPGPATPKPGPATLEACGPARTKPQEIAFWWSA
jgi:hypothetical protein